MNQKYRLVTRSDFDGLVCAVLLNELDMIDEISSSIPKTCRMARSKSPSATSPPTCRLFRRRPGLRPPPVRNAAQHRWTEQLHHQPQRPSAARVVYDYCGGKKAFPNIADDMMEAVDKADSAQYTRDDILDPKGWVLLNYLMDARTGAGSLPRIPRQQLHADDGSGSNTAVTTPSTRYCNSQTFKGAGRSLFRTCRKGQGTNPALHHGPSEPAVLDLRREDTIYATNRFMIYALFPQTNISIHVMWGVQKQNTVFATGKSILDRSSQTNVGELMLQYGGGGHQAAGTCQVPNEQADALLLEIAARINADETRA